MNIIKDINWIGFLTRIAISENKDPNKLLDFYHLYLKLGLSETKAVLQVLKKEGLAIL